MVEKRFWRPTTVLSRLLEWKEPLYAFSCGLSYSIHQPFWTCTSTCKPPSYVACQSPWGISFKSHSSSVSQHWCRGPGLHSERDRESSHALPSLCLCNLCGFEALWLQSMVGGSVQDWRPHMNFSPSVGGLVQIQDVNTFRTCTCTCKLLSDVAGQWPCAWSGRH